MITNQDSRYLKKDEFGYEVFNYRAYEDDEQMNELARMREERRKLVPAVLKNSLLRFFCRQKSL